MCLFPIVWINEFAVWVEIIPPTGRGLLLKVPKFWRRLLQVPEPLGSLDTWHPRGRHLCPAGGRCPLELPRRHGAFKLCQFVMTKVSQMSCFSWDWDQCAAFSSTFSHVSSSTLVLHVGKSHEFMPICIIPQRLCFVPGCPRDQARTHNYTSCHSTRTPVTRFGLRMSQDVLSIEISSS